MITTEQTKRLEEIFARGLSSGLGDASGQVCIEAVVCQALGEPHGDRPSCVHEIDRSLLIRLNDSAWSSPEARAAGMWPLALPQLGTAGADRSEWLAMVIEGTIRVIVPMALRAAALVHKDQKHRDALEAAAVRCEEDGDQAAANAADAAYAAYAAAAADAAADAAYAAADAAAYAAYAAANAADAAYAAANADAAANAADAAYAAANADAAIVRDQVLAAFVDVVLSAYCAEGRA